MMCAMLGLVLARGLYLLGPNEAVEPPTKGRKNIPLIEDALDRGAKRPIHDTGLPHSLHRVCSGISLYAQ